MSSTARTTSEADDAALVERDQLAEPVALSISDFEALRAFDIAFITNQGKNGLELLSILIYNNSISEASLVGFGSAIAVILLLISLVPIVAFLSRVMRTLA